MGIFSRRMYCQMSSSVQLLKGNTRMRLRLHQVGMHLAAMRKGAYPRLEGFHIALYNQVPSVFLGIFVAELNHFLELPLGVDVHQGEGHLARIEGLFGQTHHHGRVLADAIEHHRILELGRHLTNDMNGLGFEFLQMTKFVLK